MPNWNPPANIRAYMTTRRAPGVSAVPFDDCNLGDHVGDDPLAVQRNRELVCSALDLPQAPRWMRQVHGTVVWRDENGPAADTGVDPIIADAAVSVYSRTVLVVMTADCLPILLAAKDGDEIAAVHAGWRGLASGVIDSTIGAMRSAPHNLIAWLGPAIGPNAFEVGDDVHAAFIAVDPAAAAAFRAIPSPGERKWLCDIYWLARLRLAALGIRTVTGGEYCTFSDPTRFHSYRRDRICGRMASLIWME